MNNLNLPNPKLMDVAVPANLKTGTGLKESLHKSIIFNRSDLENIKHSFLLVDLREAAEIGKTGMLPGAVHIPYKDLIHAIGDPNSSLMQAYNKGDMIIFYCAYGERSALAIKIAKENKLEKVGHLDGGFHKGNT